MRRSHTLVFQVSDEPVRDVAQLFEICSPDRTASGLMDDLKNGAKRCFCCASGARVFTSMTNSTRECIDRLGVNNSTLKKFVATIAYARSSTDYPSKATSG